MREKIHPKFYPNAVVTCSCGNSWTTGSTMPEIRTDVCSQCHPFYTGEQRIVDTAGQVDRFMKRLDRKGSISQAEQARIDEAKRQAEEDRIARRRGGAPVRRAESA